MNDYLEKLKELAKPMISGYKVSCFIETDIGNFNGINVEITPQYNLHAEQSGIHNALINGATEIKKIVLQDSPCGHCRQLINEIDSNIIINVNNKEKFIKDLLPDAYTLEKKLSVFTNNENLIFVKEKTISVSEKECNLSFSPYTNSKAGVSIYTKNNIYHGRYVESWAFNMSIHPFLGALSQLFLNNDNIENIEEIYLTIDENSKIDHIKSTIEILSYLCLDNRLIVNKIKKEKT